MSRYHLIEHLVYEIHATIFPIHIERQKEKKQTGAELDQAQVKL